MKNLVLFFSLLGTTVYLAGCNDQAGDAKTADTKDSFHLKEERVTYGYDTVKLKGFVYYNQADTEKRPAVLVIPEWWGLTEYPKMRARELAKLGYVAMVADMYGNGAVADNPTLAQQYATPFYTNPALAGSRFMAALNELKFRPQTDSTRVAAIGYCFGGSMVLNAAKMGASLQGVVSFHGDLRGVPADKNLLKARILVCHGEADSFVPQEQVTAFRKQMDSIGADYTFKSYADATHAFTNPGATETGERFGMPIKYNAAADSASWKDMQDFFGRIFK